MEQYKSEKHGFSFPAPSGDLPDDDWFDVAGDLDDFIFYDPSFWEDDHGEGRYTSNR